MGKKSFIAVLGTTGTGKSTFIHLLTKDDNIHAGHTPDSETSTIQTAQYTDEETNRTVVLIDTPGFDDSREGVSDTDVLETITRYLEPENSEACRLNGIIYMHRISDPRVGGVARKNLRMLQALCGDNNLDHVRIITTNWGRIKDEDGKRRQDALARGAFKDLIEHKAKIRRHTDTIESAQEIVSELLSLSPITLQIQKELQRGIKLGDTSAGAILTAEIREMKKKHEKELTDLKRQIEDAAAANDSALRAELDEERKELKRKMERAKEDRNRLDRAPVITREKPKLERRSTNQQPLPASNEWSETALLLLTLFLSFLVLYLASTYRQSTTFYH